MPVAAAEDWHTSIHAHTTQDKEGEGQTSSAVAQQSLAGMLQPPTTVNAASRVLQRWWQRQHASPNRQHLSPSPTPKQGGHGCSAACKLPAVVQCWEPLQSTWGAKRAPDKSLQTSLTIFWGGGGGGGTCTSTTGLTSAPGTTLQWSVHASRVRHKGACVPSNAVGEVTAYSTSNT